VDMKETSVDWWSRRPRKVSVLVDNPSWILPYASDLVARINRLGDNAELVRRSGDLKSGDVNFIIGCIDIVPTTFLDLHRRNLVVHESDLPRGRGMSPLTWQILEGENVILVCLLYATERVDEGDVVYRDKIKFDGHELIDEIRDAQGKLTIDLCLRFLAESEIPMGKPQNCTSTYYKRRQPVDSELDISKSICDQFNLLRVSDPNSYPAFFKKNGRFYKLKVERLIDPPGGSSNDEENQE
jgi:methionyl-tRNA formyltransferase